MKWRLFAVNALKALLPTLSQNMDSSVINLFQYARTKVTDQDILDYSPGDPGYFSYVQIWTHIRKTGAIPQRVEFNLSEVIRLTGWGNPDEMPCPERFRIYRRFTSAVGVALLHYGNDSECVRPANYLARDLIADAACEDRKYLDLLIAVFRSTRGLLKSTGLEPEYPFFTFAMMILHQLNGGFSSGDHAASLLIEDESQVRHDESLNYLIENDNFLLGLTNYNQLHGDWQQFALRLTNPNKQEDTQLVIDAVAEER